MTQTHQLNFLVSDSWLVILNTMSSNTTIAVPPTWNSASLGFVILFAACTLRFSFHNSTAFQIICICSTCLQSLLTSVNPTKFIFCALHISLSFSDFRVSLDRCSDIKPIPHVLCKSSSAFYSLLCLRRSAQWPQFSWFIEERLLIDVVEHEDSSYGQGILVHSTRVTSRYLRQ